MGLVYGAKGLIWYTYESRYPEPSSPLWWPADFWFSVEFVDNELVPGYRVEPPMSWHTFGLVVRTDSTNEYTEYDSITNKWYEVQQLNEILEIIGPDLLALNWESAFTSTDDVPSGSTVQDVAVSDVEIGDFIHNSTAENYFMLLNRRCESTDTRTFTVTLESSSNRRLIEDVLASRTPWDGAPNRVAYRTLESGEDEIVVTLEPGEGRLFRVTNGLHGSLTEDRYWSGQLFVIDNLTIEDSVTLQIDYNTIVEFSPDKWLTINGKLNAIGTATEPVVLTRAGNSGYWKGTSFSNSSDDNSLINYCQISYANSGIDLNSASPTISHTTLNYCKNYGIYAKNTQSLIEYCNISDNKYGIRCVNTGTVHFKYNTLERNNYRGMILSNSSPIISNCDILSTQHSTLGYGIFCSYQSNPSIRNCNIKDNGSDGIRCYSGSSPSLVFIEDGALNRIENNNRHGVYTSGDSWPNLGQLTNPGHNAIINNGGKQVYNNNGGSAHIYAQKNYWGLKPDSSELFYGHVIYKPFLKYDPTLRQYSYEGEPNIPDPEDVINYYIYSGTNYYANQMYENAIADFEFVISNFPDSSQARYALIHVIKCLLTMKKEGEIVTYLEKLALKLGKDNKLQSFVLFETIPFMIR